MRTDTVYPRNLFMGPKKYRFLLKNIDFRLFKYRFAFSVVNVLFFNYESEFLIIAYSGRI